MARLWMTCGAIGQSTPRTQATLDAVTVSLDAQEKAVSGSGTNKTTHRHTVWSEKTQIEGTREIHAHSPVALSANVVLPHDAPFSFHAEDNEIEWTLTLRIEIPQWPDWVQKHTLLVVPPA